MREPASHDSFESGCCGAAARDRFQMRGARFARRLIGIVGVFVVIVVAVLVWQRGHENARAAIHPTPPAIPVSTSTAAERDVPIFLDALGTIQASNTVSVRSQIDGKLQSVKFVEGQNVKAGDTLAIIDP